MMQFYLNNMKNEQLRLKYVYIYKTIDCNSVTRGKDIELFMNLRILHIA